MKKILLISALLFIAASPVPASAASIFSMTVKDCTVEKAQDVIVDVFTGKNFAPEDITNSKMTFTKNFGDGFWTAAQNNTVKVNLIPRDGNIRIMVTQTEKIFDGFVSYERKRSIDHLLPILKEIKSILDGTPIEQIQNEAVDQLPGSGNERKKPLGLDSFDKDEKGNAVIKKVVPGSIADAAKLAAGDVIIDINGRDTASMDLQAMTSYIANKWGAGSSMILTVLRDGNYNTVKLSPDKD